MNSKKGVVRYKDLTDAREEEILENVAAQGIKEVRKIRFQRDGRRVITGIIILTFGLRPVFHTSIKGFLRVKVDVYIPNSQYSTVACQTEMIRASWGPEAKPSAEKNSQYPRLCLPWLLLKQHSQRWHQPLNLGHNKRWWNTHTFQKVSSKRSVNKNKPSYVGTKISPPPKKKTDEKKTLSGREKKDDKNRIIAQNKFNVLGDILNGSSMDNDDLDNAVLLPNSFNL